MTTASSWLDENLGDVMRELAHHVGGHPEAMRHLVRSDGVEVARESGA